MRLLILSLIAALAAAALPSAASAQGSKIRVFKVTAEGSGTYERSQKWEGLPGLVSEVNASSSFAWKVNLPAVAFLPNGEAALTGDAGGAVSGNLTGQATEETILRGLDGRGNTITTRGYCEAKDANETVSTALVKPDLLTGDPGATGANLTVLPFGGVAFDANCTANIYGGAARLGVAAGPGAFDQRFFLPTEATRQGKIIQLVQASPQQRNNCAPADNVTSCKLDWSGTLTFEFTGYLGGGDRLEEEDIPPVPPGAGPPAQQPGATPQDEDDLVVPLPSRARLSGRGDSAVVSVTCVKACAGTVGAYPARGTRGAAVKALASKRFKAPAGKAVKVSLRFRGAALRKVRKARAVRLVIDTGTAKKSLVVRARR